MYRPGARAIIVATMVVAGVFAFFASPGNADAANICGSREIWINDLEYGTPGGGVYWDPLASMVWTPSKDWHYFAPEQPRPQPAPLWVNQLDYGSKGGGFYWDPVSGQVWTAEHGWHIYSAFGCGGTFVPSTWQLVDVASAKVTTLHESYNEYAWARFDDQGVLIDDSTGRHRFTLDGYPATSEPPPAPWCRDAENGAEVDGTHYAGARCGLRSPDKRWMTYSVDRGLVALPSGTRVRLLDRWVVNLETKDKELIQAGLTDCYGCGVGPPGPAWSPSSHYLSYRETGGEHRGFLTDVYSGITRRIGYLAEWSPATDILVYGSQTGDTATFEDLSAGTAHPLPLQWPATFDPTGRLLYSPAWAYHGGPSSTTVVTVETGLIVARLPGSTPYWFWWTGGKALTATTSGFLAALQNRPGCAGTAIYVDGSYSRCIDDGMEGRVGPTGQLVVTRKTGSVGPAFGVGWGAASIDKVEIVLVDSTGDIRTLVAQAFALDYVPPLIGWNAAGTHLLVYWPRLTPE